jgi:large subunit ribosomal protein L35
VLLLLEQQSQIPVPIVEAEQRIGFNVRRFMSDHGLDGSDGGGAHMWREVWDEEVSRIYSDVLSKRVDSMD